jgi:hypothetical protein
MICARSACEKVTLIASAFKMKLVAGIETKFTAMRTIVTTNSSHDEFSGNDRTGQVDDRL